MLYRVCGERVIFRILLMDVKSNENQCKLTFAIDRVANLVSGPQKTWERGCRVAPAKNTFYNVLL